MACHTQEQIAEEVGMKQGGDFAAIIGELENLEALPKSLKLAALHEDADWQPPRHTALC